MMAQMARRPTDAALTGLISLVAGLFELSSMLAPVEGAGSDAVEELSG